METMCLGQHITNNNRYRTVWQLSCFFLKENTDVWEKKPPVSADILFALQAVAARMAATPLIWLFSQEGR